MPIQLTIFERRDNGNRDEIAKAALELCRIYRKQDGITSARYYWTGDGIAFIVEGEGTALNSLGSADTQGYSRAAFVLMDNARTTLSSTLREPREALQIRDAGR